MKVARFDLHHKDIGASEREMSPDVVSVAIFHGTVQFGHICLLSIRSHERISALKSRAVKVTYESFRCKKDI